MSKNSFIECTILSLSCAQIRAHRGGPLVCLRLIYLYFPFNDNTIYASTRCCAYSAEMAGVLAIDTTYLIPIKIRALLFFAPLIFAPLIFTHPKKPAIRAPLIFAHWLKFAPL